MTSPVLGFTLTVSDDGVLPATYADMTVLGLVLPSDDADNTVFPLNQIVDVNTGDPAVLAGAGTGPLSDTLQLINAQLADFEVSARAVVCRVPSGVDVNHTIANIVGDPALGSGFYAMLKASAQLGVVPRLLGAPGFTGVTSQTAGATVVNVVRKTGMVGAGTLTLATPAYLAGVEAGTYKVVCTGGAKSASSAAKGAGNTGNGTLGSLTVDADAIVGAWRVVCAAAAAGGGQFIVLHPDGTFDGIATVGVPYNSPHGPNFTLAHGTVDFVAGDEFDVTVANAVPAGGGVFSVTAPDGTVLSPATVGVAYAAQLGFTIAASGTDYAIGDEWDLVVTITGGVVEANPICAMLPSVCSKLLAHCIVGSYVPGTTLTKTQEIAWRTTLNDRRTIPLGNAVVVGNGVVNKSIDHAAVVLGMGVASDFQNKGVPATVFGNRVIKGILGFDRYDSFSLLDGATDGQELLAAGIGVLARGEAIETAATSSGFVSESYRNADTDTIWQFYNKSRIRDYTHLALLRTLRQRLLVTNVTPHSIQAVINDMSAIAAKLKAVNASVGFAVGFNNATTASDLRVGRFGVVFSQEEPAPIVVIDIDSTTDYAALEAELTQVIQTQATALVTG